MSNYALVTGASQGLGRAIALEFAKRQTNLILVSLPNEGLLQLAEELVKYQVKVHCFETDLSIRENVEELALNINAEFQIQYLINNAGRGGSEYFGTVSNDYLIGILQLNIVATTMLTKLLLPNLQQQKQAYVLNISSMAAFSPIAFKTVYPASKAFIRHWSLALREELRGTGISVSVVYPGPMKTNADTTQRIEKQGFKGRMGLLSVAEVASISIQLMLHKKSSIVPGFTNKVNRWLLVFLPTTLATSIISRSVEKEL